MQFWISFWTAVLIAAVAIFTGLAVVVAIGGFFDVKAMFRTILTHHAEEDEPHQPS
jgi:hypothetical protein